MVYTAFEIVFFLIVAAVLGLVLGWLLRGKSIRERLESQWRRLLDDERNNHRQTHDQLKRVKAENETLGENFRREKIIPVVLYGFEDCPWYPGRLGDFHESNILSFSFTF